MRLGVGVVPRGAGLGHDVLGAAVGDLADQPAQRVAAARQARADRAHRHVEHLGHVLVAHAFEPDQQDHLALLLGKLGQRAVEVAQFEPSVLARRLGQQWLGFTQFDGRALAHGAANAVDVLIMENCE